MLRALLAVLLLANLGWWAWHWPPLAQRLGTTADEREPARLARQIQPGRIRLLPPASAAAQQAADAAAAAASTTPSAPSLVPSQVPAPETACLEAGPLDDAGFGQARGDLGRAGAAADAWVELRRERPGHWAVYMGRFADAAQAQKKIDELQHLNLPHEDAPAPFSPGLILARFDSDAQAQARLKELQGRGVRTARVLVLQPPAVEHRVRVEHADAALAARLRAAGTAARRWHDCGP